MSSSRLGPIRRDPDSSKPGYEDTGHSGNVSRRSDFYRRDLPEERQQASREDARPLPESPPETPLNPGSSSNARRHSLAAAAAAPDRPMLLSRSATSITAKKSEPVTDPRIRLMANGHSPAVPFTDSPISASPASPSSATGRPEDRLRFPRPSATVVGTSTRSERSSAVAMRSESSRNVSLDTLGALAEASTERLSPITVPVERVSTVDAVASLMIEFGHHCFFAARAITQQDTAKEDLDRQVHIDEKNKRQFKDYHALIEQGEEARRLAQKKHTNAVEKARGAQAQLNQFGQKAVHQVLELIHIPTSGFSNPADTVRTPTDDIAGLQGQFAQFLASSTAINASLREQDTKISGRLTETRSVADLAFSRTNDLTKKLIPVEKSLQRLSLLEDKVEAVENAGTESAKADPHNFERLVARVDALESELQKETQDTSSLRRSLSTRASQSEMQKHKNAADRSFSNLVESHSALAGFYQKQKQDIEKSTESMNALKKTVTSHDSDLREGQQAVESLQKAVQNLTSRMDAFADAGSKSNASTSAPSYTGTVPSATNRLVDKAASRAPSERGSSSTPAPAEASLKMIQLEVKKLQTSLAGLDKARLNDFGALAQDVTECQHKLVGIEQDNTNRDELVIEKVEGLQTRVENCERAQTGLAVDVQRIDTRLGAHDNFHTEVTQKQASLSMQVKHIGQLETAVNAQGQSVGQVQQNFYAHDQSIRGLNSRMNNLTTEKVVKAMAQQMSIMYPYAANAQAELAKVIEDRSHIATIQERFNGIEDSVALKEDLVAKLKQHDEKISALEASTTLKEDLASKVAEHAKALNSLQQSLQENANEHEKGQVEASEKHEKLIGDVTAAKKKLEDQLQDVERMIGQLRPMARAHLSEAALQKPSSQSQGNQVGNADDDVVELKARDTPRPRSGSNLGKKRSVEHTGQYTQASPHPPTKKIKKNSQSSSSTPRSVHDSVLSTQLDVVRDPDEIDLDDWTRPLPGLSKSTPSRPGSSSESSHRTNGVSPTKSAGKLSKRKNHLAEQPGSKRKRRKWTDIDLDEIPDNDLPEDEDYEP